MMFFGFFARMMGNLFTRICVLWFRVAGWKIPKRFPEGLRNYILVVAPHTSNVDFFVGVAARKILGIKVKYLAKRELFKFPIKGMLLSLGGYPVDRSQSTSLVDFVVDRFEQDGDFALTVTPEGTRGKVDKWKTGFYHMARAAEVPVVQVGFDFHKKWVVLSEPRYLSADMDKELASMRKFADSITPRYPCRPVGGPKGNRQNRVQDIES